MSKREYIAELEERVRVLERRVQELESGAFHYRGGFFGGSFDSYPVLWRSPNISVGGGDDTNTVKS